MVVPPTIPHWLQKELHRPNPVFNTGLPVPQSFYNTPPPAIVNPCKLDKINTLLSQKYKNTKMYPDLPSNSEQEISNYHPPTVQFRKVQQNHQTRGVLDNNISLPSPRERLQMNHDEARNIQISSPEK